MSDKMELPADEMPKCPTGCGRVLKREWGPVIESSDWAAYGVCPGGDWDRWDLEVRAGVSGRVRALLTIEEHGSGRQQLRFRLIPHHRAILGATALMGLLAFCAVSYGALAAGLTLAAGALGASLLILGEAGVAMGRLRKALAALPRSE